MEELLGSNPQVVRHRRPARTPKPKSYADYLAAVKAQGELRVELIDGEIYMAPAPVPMHQIIVGNLMLLLGTHVRLKRLGVVLTAPLDVELKPGADTVQPDLVFIRQERLAELLGARQIKGAPDLIVEVLSPSTRRLDRTVKLPAYARYGVSEFWLVDPDEQSVEVYVLDGRTYRVAAIYLAGDAIAVGQFVDADIAVDEVFGLVNATELEQLPATILATISNQA